jgi:hypothetical protein
LQTGAEGLAWCGKKAGPEDNRTEGKRFHDALQQPCTRLPRV